MKHWLNANIIRVHLLRHPMRNEDGHEVFMVLFLNFNVSILDLRIKVEKIEGRNV